MPRISMVEGGPPDIAQAVTLKGRQQDCNSNVAAR